jgi:hypothetical protein
MDPIKIKDVCAGLRWLNNSKDAIYELDKGFRVDAAVGLRRGTRAGSERVWNIGPTIIRAVFVIGQPLPGISNVAARLGPVRREIIYLAQ